MQGRTPFGFVARQGRALPARRACCPAPLRNTRGRGPAPPPVPVVDVLYISRGYACTAYCSVVPNGAALVTAGFCWTNVPDVLPTVDDNNVDEPYATPEFSLGGIIGPDNEDNYGRAYVIDADGTVWYSDVTYFETGLCLLDGTQIAVWDRTTGHIHERPIEDIWYNDTLVVWDFDNGTLTGAQPMWIKRETPVTKCVTSRLDNGRTLRTVGEHRVLPVTSDAFVPVGRNQRVVTLDAATQRLTTATVMTQDRSQVPTTRCSHNIVTDTHINLFADGVLTSCRYNNRAPIDAQAMTFLESPVEEMTAPHEELSSHHHDHAYLRGLRVHEAPPTLRRGALDYMTQMWTARARSVLFLDHQGVMRTRVNDTPGTLVDFDAAAVCALNKLLALDPALEIVLISDWQGWVPLGTMQEFYAAQGVTRPPVAYAGGGGDAGCRSGRIVQWLREQCQSMPRTCLHKVPPLVLTRDAPAAAADFPTARDNGIGLRWVAVDDLPLSHFLQPDQVVQTLPNEGLAAEKALQEVQARMWWLHRSSAL